MNVRELFNFIRKETHRLGFIFVVLFFVMIGVWSLAPLFFSSSLSYSTKVLATDGTVLFETAPQGMRSIVLLDSLPASTIDALLAAEDARFYSHRGIDARGVIAAIIDNVRHKKVVRGASTIEQQLLKNTFYAGRSRTILQKIREGIGACAWATTHSKHDTLERYFNTVGFGNELFGIQSASQAYFHTNVDSLNLSQSAMLAGIIAAPSRYEPVGNFDAAKARQKYVLNQMRLKGMISQEEYDDAVNAPVPIFTPRHSITAPHFVFRVLDEAEKKFPDIRSGGYVITTTLDAHLQKRVEAIIDNRLIPLTRKEVSNAAVQVVNPATGEIRAYAGSADYFADGISGKIDMIATKRQPGSSLKPFLYFSALLSGYTPATIIPDLPVRYETADGKSYYPRNYSYKYYGPVTVRDALGSSLNIPAVRVLHTLGFSKFFDTLARFGIRFPESSDHYGLSVVLGGGEVALESIVHGYASLANLGSEVPSFDIARIEKNNKVVFEMKPQKPRKLFEDELSSDAAALITDILSDKTARAQSFGETSLLEVGTKKIAVKTGTTYDFHDNWAFGYTPDTVVGVWVGNANNIPMEGVTGISGAVPIMHDVFSYVYKSSEPPMWPRHELITKKICVTSGLLATPQCPKTRDEHFIVGTEPQLFDSWYVSVSIDSVTGKLATLNCTQHIIKKTFLKLPAEYTMWSSALGFEIPPTTDCEGRLIASVMPTLILSPIDGDYIEIDPHLSLENQKIPFVVGGFSAQGYDFVLNDKVIHSDNSTFLWTPQSGEYSLSLRGSSSLIHFFVR